jgi:hypothetical protein
MSRISSKNFLKSITIGTIKPRGVPLFSKFREAIDLLTCSYLCSIFE